MGASSPVVHAVRGIGEALMGYPGVSFVAGMMMKAPGLKSAATTVFGSEMVARARSKTVSLLDGGGLGLMDRRFDYEKPCAETASINGADLQKPEAAKNSNIFSKLKKMYASVRDRGTHNAALGAVGAALAAVSLAALVINPAAWVYAALFAGIAVYGKFDRTR